MRRFGKKTFVWALGLAWLFWALNHHFLQCGVRECFSPVLPETLIAKTARFMLFYAQEVFAVIFAIVSGSLLKDMLLEFPLSLSRAFNWKLLSIEKAAQLAAQALSLPQTNVLHGLLIATYQGDFANKLYGVKALPTAEEEKLTSLALRIKNGRLKEQKKQEALEKLRVAYKKYNTINSEKDEPTEQEILNFFLGPLWAGTSVETSFGVLIYKTSAGETRPTKYDIIDDKFLLGLLSIYEEAFQSTFKNYKNKSTFSELKEQYPNEFYLFIRISPRFYRTTENWAKAIPIDLIQSIILNEFNKMYITGEAFKSWLRKYLDGEYENIPAD